MKQELTDQLIKKYPEFFDACKSEPTDSCHTPMYLFGIECNDGWYNLLDSLFTELRHATVPVLLRTKDDVVPQIVQIKEKLGGLRFYVSGATNAQYKVISKYENLSYHTCEECGAKGKLRNHYGWLLVACKPCFKVMLEKHWRSSTYWQWYRWNMKGKLKRKLGTIKYKLSKLFRYETYRKNR